jgi:hypothetical protein
MSDGNTYDMNTTDIKITNCPDGSFCCGDQVEGGPCCSQGKGVWILGGVVYSTKPVSTSTSLSTFLPSSTMTTTITSTPSNEKPNEGSDHAGLYAGSVVGGVAIIAIVAAVLWFFIWRHKRNHSHYATTPRASPHLDEDMKGFAGATVYAHQSQSLHELGHVVMDHELAVSTGPVEAGGTAVRQDKGRAGLIQRHELAT